MKRSAINYLVIICFLLAPFSIVSVAAQDQELLTNPGFEAPFTVSTDDPPHEVAEGWSRWHVPSIPGAPSYLNSEPEYYEVAPNVDRIRSGSNAQLFSTLYASYIGGVYQTVSGITPGSELEFSVYAWVWSTTYNEVDLSEEDGDLLVTVGIDPTGGTNGESTSIIWSEPVEAYDAYNQYSVTATADGDTVTVFVRATAGFPVRHNNVYLDDASLTIAGEGTGGEPTETVEPSEEPTEESTPEVTPTDEPTAAPEITDEPTATAVTDPLPEPTDEVSPTDAPPPAEPAPATIEPATATATIAPTDEPTAAPEVTAEPTDEVSPTVEPATSTTIAPVENTATPTDEPATAEPPTIAPDPASATPVFVPPTSTAIPPAASATFTPTALPSVTAFPTATPIESTGGGSDPTPGFGQSIRYTVQNGDTVARIAQRFNSSITAIRDANGLNANYLIFVGQELIIPTNLVVPPTSTPIGSNQPTAVPSAQPPSGNTAVYIVQRGDSLYRIAQNFNTTIGTLAQLNGIVNVSLLQLGQRLIVPVPDTGPTPTPPTDEPRVYVVRYGDTLYRLSLLFGVPIREIAQANGIRQLNLIYVGQRLIIP